jgi:hypothetical protein
LSQDKGSELFIAGALTWLRAILLNETLKFRAEEYLRIRYEDLVTTLRKVVSEILTLAGQEVSRWSLTNEGELEFDINHTVSGNFMRFKEGNIEVAWTRNGTGA